MNIWNTYVYKLEDGHEVLDAEHEDLMEYWQWKRYQYNYIQNFNHHNNQ